MGWYDWDNEPARPRRRADGIKARTQRGGFGKTWWAGRWIAALEQLVDANRLTRGRSYARSGQVLNLDVVRGGVNARVQGSRVTPYKVGIHFRPLSNAEWEGVIDAMSGEALYAARLLSGEMPEQIEEVFAAAGTSLFPATGTDLTTECSCPDWANPCKHAAAVHYLLGERFDADPFLIFELRGRGQQEIAAGLRARRNDQGADAAETNEGERAEDPPPPLPAEPALFWAALPDTGDTALRLDAPSVDALPVKLLGPPPFAMGRTDVTAELESIYRAAGAYAREMLTGPEVEE